MNFKDLIEKKKHGREHTEEDFEYITSSILNGSVPDAQLSAWLMAVCFKGLNNEELVNFTKSLAKSGKQTEISELSGILIDKHSTGGVGDKLTIALIPLLAAAGVSVLKISDKSYASIVGTVDKLESIPNFNTNYSVPAMINQVKNIGAVFASQTEDIAPAEKKLYSLRCLTSTVNSKELITASILSKKIASGVNDIFVDVKYGSGSFVKTSEEAYDLSNLIVKTGAALDKSVTAVVSSADEPLGRAVGNSIEVIESIEFLKGNIKDGDFAYLTYYFASIVLVKTGMQNDMLSAKNYLQKVIESGKAIAKFKEIIFAQGGDTDVVDHYDKFVLPSYKIQCESKEEGYIQNINAAEIATAVANLGAVRTDLISDVDYSVGVYLNKKQGEYVKKGETLYTIYSNDEEMTLRAQWHCDNAYVINSAKPAFKSVVYNVIGIEEEDV